MHPHSSAPVVVATRRPWQWIAGAVVALVVAQLVFSAATNPRFRWDTFGEYFFDARVLRGLLLTIELTVLSMAASCVLGGVFAAMRMADNRFLNAISWAYIWCFRALPALVVLIFAFNLSALYPQVSIGIPFGPTFVTAETNDLVTAFTAAVIGLVLHESAYMAEIIRGGLLSVPKAQREAAASLGMSRWRTFRRVVLPQAMRSIIPPTFNEIIGMLKLTSLVSVIALSDLLYTVQQIYAINFQPIPLLLVASTWYLIATTILMAAQHYIERFYGRSTVTRYRTPALRLLIRRDGRAPANPRLHSVVGGSS